MCQQGSRIFLPFASMLFGQRIGVHSVLMFFSLDSRYKLDFLKGAGLLRLCVRDNLHLSFAEIGLLLEIEMGLLHHPYKAAG